MNNSWIGQVDKGNVNVRWDRFMLPVFFLCFIFNRGLSLQHCDVAVSAVCRHGVRLHSHKKKLKKHSQDRSSLLASLAALVSL